MSIRLHKVLTARQRIESGFYENPQVIAEMIDRMEDECPDLKNPGPMQTGLRITSAPDCETDLDK